MDGASQDIVCDAIIPVYEGFPVDGDPFVIGQEGRPGPAVAVDGPVVPVETPPEYGPAFAVQVLIIEILHLFRAQSFHVVAGQSRMQAGA